MYWGDWFLKERRNRFGCEIQSQIYSVVHIVVGKQGEDICSMWIFTPFRQLADQRNIHAEKVHPFMHLRAFSYERILVRSVHLTTTGG